MLENVIDTRSHRVGNGERKREKGRERKREEGTLTGGQSAETDRKLRAEIDSARLFRCSGFIRAQAENDDATALDRLEIIPYGSTDICGDDITLLDLVQKEEYGAEFSDEVDATGKTVVTVRFHAVLKAGAAPAFSNWKAVADV